MGKDERHLAAEAIAEPYRDPGARLCGDVREPEGHSISGARIGIWIRSGTNVNDFPRWGMDF